MGADSRPIAVIGAHGKTGRRVMRRLEKLEQAVRPLSRSTTQRFDWSDPTGWATALKGARAAYVTFQPDLAVPHARASIARLGNVAREHNLEHIVLLSGRGEEGALAAELALATSGIAWTVVRASWFAQNFSESFLVDAVRSGELALPVEEVAEPFVDAEDIADVAVAALMGTIPDRRTYELTGPTALTFADAAATIGKAAGMLVVLRKISSDDFRDRLRLTGIPEPVVAMLVELFTTTLDGRNAKITSGVHDALGRAPRSFDEYAYRTAGAGAWDN